MKICYTQHANVDLDIDTRFDSDVETLDSNYDDDIDGVWEQHACDTEFPMNFDIHAEDCPTFPEQNIEAATREASFVPWILLRLQERHYIPDAATL